MPLTHFNACLVIALTATTIGCGRTQEGSTVAGSNAYEDPSGDAADPITDSDLDLTLTDPAYGDVDGLARVKLFALGAKGCANWEVRVRDASDDEDSDLRYVFKRPARTEARLDKDGVYGVDLDGKETLLTRANRGQKFKEFLLKVRTHNGRDGMVFLRNGTGAIEVSGEYKPCDGGATNSFDDRRIAMTNGKTRWDAQKPGGELLTRVRVAKDKAKRGKGKGTSN